MEEKVTKSYSEAKKRTDFPSNNAGTGQDPALNRSYKTILKDTFIQYLQTTSLHGLKFIGDRTISESERFFFLFAFIVSVLTSSYYISAIYIKWHSTPLLITTSSTSTSISSIPFPAITICNLNQAKKSLVDHIKPGMEDYTNLQTLCKNEQGLHMDNLTETDNWEHFRSFILKASQPCEEMLLSCRYGSVEKDCRDVFEPTLTDEGLCCTFNVVHPDFMLTEYSRDNVVDPNAYVNIITPINWTPEGGFQEDLPDDYFPRKAIGTGVNMGLSLVINASINDYYCSTSRSVGFKMSLHNPTEMPKIANYGYLLSAGLETHVVIHPTLHNAANNIRRIRKAARHCLFADEVKLKFYRTYTKGNCELECESDRMEHECGCVTYYLPRSSKNTVVCGLKDFECVRRVQYASESLLDEDTSCARCVPGCVSLNYLPVISGTELLKEDFILKENFSNPDINIEELAVIHFFYEFNSFRARTKEEFLGFADFLAANSGGILGLFLGFSMLSVIELLYFMFLLPHTIIKNYFSRKKDIHKEEDISEASTSVFNSNISGIGSFPSNPYDPKLRRYGGDFRTSYGYYGQPGTLKVKGGKKVTVENNRDMPFPYYD